MKDGKINVYYILIGILSITLIVFLIMVIVINYKYKDVSEKISLIDNVNKEIIMLENNYQELDNINKKINLIKEENDLINEEINKLTSSIKDLNYNISKYQK